MTCPNCLNEIEDDSVFCSICGSDLRVEVKQTSLNNINTSSNIRTKTNLAQVSIIIAIIGCALFFISAEQISKVGDDMITLQSQSGTSLAEIYYQNVGKALKGFAMFARALGSSVLAITIAIVFKEYKNN